MPKLSFWRPQKGNNYKFIDFHVLQQFNVAGAPMFLHKYLGPIESGNVSTETREEGDLSQPNYSDGKGTSNETDIQDLFFLENRDRKFAPDVYEFRGHYQISDNEFDLKQFGLFLTTDTIYITFHYNDMIAKIGRKIMPGDVLELVHLRDTDLLNSDLPAINKYYVVEDGTRDASGYDPHWLHHIWRCKCSPVNNQQEFLEILERPIQNAYGEEQTDTLGEIISTISTESKINIAIDEEADRQVPKRNYNQSTFWILPVRDPKTGELVERDQKKYPMVYIYGDAEPPNGAIAIGNGTSFPLNAVDGDFYLRTDYTPNVLFKKRGPTWVREEIDWRTRWSQANDVLRNFINNTRTLRYQETGEVIPSRQPMSKVLKPKVDE